MSESRVTQPEALRDAISELVIACSWLSDKNHAEAMRCIRIIEGALEAHGAPEPHYGHDTLIVKPDLTGLFRGVPKTRATSQAAIGAVPGNWIGSIPAEESDEEFARQVAEMDGHQAQAVASSPTPSLGHQTERSEWFPDAVGDSRVLHILDLAYKAAREHASYWYESDDDAKPWVESDTYASLKRAVTLLTETQRSSHTAGSDENESGVGAEPPALTDERKALAELVACKDYKDTGLGMSLDDYSRRKPLAWAAARAALSAAPIGVPIYSPVSHFAVNAELLIAVKSPRFTGEPPYVGDEGLLLALREDYDDLNRLRAAPIGVPAEPGSPA